MNYRDGPEAGRSWACWEIEGRYPSLSVIVLNYRKPEVTSQCFHSIGTSLVAGPSTAGSGTGRPTRNGTHSVIEYNIRLLLLAYIRECFSGSGVCLLLPYASDPPFPVEYFAYHEDVYFGWRLRPRDLGDGEGARSGDTTTTARVPVDTWQLCPDAFVAPPVCRRLAERFSRGHDDTV